MRHYPNIYSNITQVGHSKADFCDSYGKNKANLYRAPFICQILYLSYYDMDYYPVKL